MRQSSINCILFIFFLINTSNQSVATKLKFEDVDMTYVNQEFIDDNTFDLSVNYINSTYNTLRCKVVVLKEFPEGMRVSLKTYGYAFGNYRILMGISVDISTCDLKSKPIFMAPFITAIGGDLDKCGPDVGEYRNDSFIPVNVDKLPTVLPANKYLMDVEVGNEDTKIVHVQFFISIT